MQHKDFSQPFSLDHSKWLNLPEFYFKYQDDISFVICIGYNSIGKTYSVEDYFASLIKKGLRCVGLRNTYEEAKKCVAGWVDVLTRHHMTDKYRVRTTGVYKINPGKAREDILICPFIYLSSPDSSIPQFDGSRAYCGDEFIPSNEGRAFTIKNVKRVLTKLTNRTARGGEGWYLDTKIPFFFLSNLNTLESDLLCAMGIDLDYEALYDGKDILKLDIVNRRLIIVSPKEWDIKETEGQRHYGPKSFGTDQEDVYPIPHPTMKRIYPNRPENSQFMYNLTFFGADNQFSVFRCFLHDRPFLYIEKLGREHTLDTNYCIDLSDKNNNNLLIQIEQVKQYIPELCIDKLENDSIAYDSPYTRKHINLMMDRIQSILFNDN